MVEIKSTRRLAPVAKGDLVLDIEGPINPNHILLFKRNTVDAKYVAESGGNQILIFILFESV